MEKELSKSKIIFAATVGIVFVVMVALFIVAVTKQKYQPMPMPVPAVNEGTNASSDMNTDMNTEDLGAAKIDEMEFEDPGDDEVGKDIKELDKLINDTRPSELNGDDLSDDLVGGDLELE